MGRLGRNMGALYAYHGYGRDLAFFWVKGYPTDVLKGMHTELTFDPYVESDFEIIINTCIPLSYAVNSINRAMGIPDVYPFEISPTIVHKLAFIHKLLLPMRDMVYVEEDALSHV